MKVYLLTLRGFYDDWPEIQGAYLSETKAMEALNAIPAAIREDYFIDDYDIIE